jgi:putative DNA primase/helicase
MPDADGPPRLKFAPLEIPAQVDAPPVLSPLRVGGPFGAMAHATCQSTQTSPTFGTLLALAAIATCVQRALAVEVAPGWVEPCSLWTFGLAESGARKTHLMQPMLAPFADWQKAARDRYRTKVAAARALRDVAEARIERLKRDAASAKTVEDREAARRAIEQELELMPEPVHAPRAFTENITAERLVSLLTENRERIAFWSDEGGQFGIMAGLYSGGAANLDAFLKAHDGSPLVTDRQAAHHFVERPALTMAVLVQPGVFVDALRNARFRHSGLLARPLFAYPESNVGRREVIDPAPVPAEVRSAYADAVRRALDEFCEHKGAPRLLCFDDEARADFLAFRQLAEVEMAPGGRLAAMPDWGSKLPGKVARMAALIEVSNSGTDAQHVSGDSLRAAMAIGELLIEHARAVFIGLGVTREHERPRALLDWIKARRDAVPIFTLREANRALEHRLRTAEDVRQAAAELTRWGVLSAPLPQKNPGARASLAWAINPQVLA